MRKLSGLRRMPYGREVVDIKALISPLRYDVVVRAQFLTALRTSSEPPGVLPEFALEHPYFLWFKYVESARFFPDLLQKPDLLRERYQSRVTRAQATLRSFDAGGYDRRFPVTVSSTPRGATSDSGVQTSKTLHIRDGCHRLALLLIDDQQLEPTMYRVGGPRDPVPDNTALLLPHLRLDELDYTRFLSCGFATRECTDLTELRSLVATQSPERLAELDAVVQAHQHAQRSAP
jgi:hypothetical protein